MDAFARARTKHGHDLGYAQVPADDEVRAGLTRLQDHGAEVEIEVGYNGVSIQPKDCSYSGVFG